MNWDLVVVAAGAVVGAAVGAAAGATVGVAVHPMSKRPIKKVETLTEKVVLCICIS